MGYRAWSALRTCFNFPLFMATGQAKNRHVEFPTSFQTKPGFVPVRFSQSELLPMSSDGTVASYFIIYWGLSCIRTLWTFEQGRWKHSSHWISRWINQFFPVWFYWNVFCTWDAFHNRNSQWCFWASVCVYNISIHVKLVPGTFGSQGVPLIHFFFWKVWVIFWIRVYGWLFWLLLGWVFMVGCYEMCMLGCMWLVLMKCLWHVVYGVVSLGFRCWKTGKAHSNYHSWWICHNDCVRCARAVWQDDGWKRAVSQNGGWTCC